jgi:hypothetical protein
MAEQVFVRASDGLIASDRRRSNVYARPREEYIAAAKARRHCDRRDPRTE